MTQQDLSCANADCNELQQELGFYQEQLESTIKLAKDEVSARDEAFALLQDDIGGMLLEEAGAGVDVFSQFKQAEEGHMETRGRRA